MMTHTILTADKSVDPYFLMRMVWTIIRKEKSRMVEGRPNTGVTGEVNEELKNCASHLPDGTQFRNSVRHDSSTKLE